MSTLAPKEGEINMGLLLSGDGKIVTNDMEAAKVPSIGLPHFFPLVIFAHVSPRSSDLLTESVTIPIIEVRSSADAVRSYRQTQCQEDRQNAHKDAGGFICCLR